METTLTTKGQITLPKSLREALHLNTGDKIVFEELQDGAYLLRPRTLKASALKGIISYKGTPKTLEDMDMAIHEQASR